MYHPYVRGKQYELILLRENAELIAATGIHPVIEPVRNDLSALQRALGALADHEASCTVVVNPQVGELVGQTDRLIHDLFSDAPESWSHVAAGYCLHAESTADRMRARLDSLAGRDFVLVHAGFSDGRALAEQLEGVSVSRHVFLERLDAGKLYRRHLPNDAAGRVLIRDGFKNQEKNAHYPSSDHFSDLHATYQDEGMSGFGDYLIVGESYSESGGPAYAVAIHLTYIDDEQDMHTYHFVSDQTDSPTNPGGKFLEALTKLAHTADDPSSHLLRTRALEEFLDLYDREHYPGLGYVKKLSMQHHLELMADFVSNE